METDPVDGRKVSAPDRPGPTLADYATTLLPWAAYSSYDAIGGLLAYPCPWGMYRDNRRDTRREAMMSAPTRITRKNADSVAK